MSKKGGVYDLKRIQNTQHLFQLFRLHLIRETSFLDAVLKIPDFFSVGICLRKVDIARVIL